MLVSGDALVFKFKDGKPDIFLGYIPAKCFNCRPEPCGLDRVFVVTSIGGKHVTLEKPALR